MCRTRRLRISDIAYRPRTTSPPHAHEHDCLIVLLEGEMGKDDRTLRPGAVAYTPAGTTHVDRIADVGGRAIVLEMLHRIDELSPRRAASLRLPVLGHRLADELAATDSAAPLALHAAALDLVATVARAPEGSAPRPFRARYGVSVGAYVRRERIRWAAKQLRATDDPIAEIALHAGFTDQSHFTRTFVRHMGVSPGRYRRSVR